MKNPSSDQNPETRRPDRQPAPNTLSEAEQRALAGAVQLKAKHPGTPDDPESRLHIDGDSDAATDLADSDDALHVDDNTLPVFGTHSNH